MNEKKFVAVCEFDLEATNLKEAEDEFSDRLSHIEADGDSTLEEFFVIEERDRIKK